MRQLTARTAQELLEDPIEEADWVIEDLLPVGAHILAGAPKIGKSWMVLAMGLAVSMGQPFWDCAVCQGGVLYLCLEDTYARVKKRLWKLTDEANDRFYLANSAATIKDGLAEQIDYFVITHPDLKLVFIDTFQKVRSPTGDSIYAADYGDFSALKAMADKYSLAMMVVHHTRKMADEDIMNTVSGSSGITGSADSIWVLKRASRGVGDATLTVTGRDVEFRELKLALRDCRWSLIERTSEEELEERDVPGCVLRVLEFMNVREEGVWSGSVGELIEAEVSGVTTATFGKFLAQHSVFMRLRGIAYSKKHTSTGQVVTLEKVACEGSEGDEGYG